VGPPRKLAPAGLIGLLLGIFGTGCFGNETTLFPPGLEPLSEVTTDPPAPTADDPYPEAELSLEKGRNPGYHWVQARGFIHASPDQVFAAITPEACLDRRQVDRHSSEWDVEPEYERSFRIHNEVDDIITVEFDVTWRAGVIEGTQEAPTVIAATWQKTWGTTFIDHLCGSIVARPVAENVTELEIVEHLRASSGDSDTIGRYVADLHAAIREVAQDRPLPPL